MMLSAILIWKQDGHENEFGPFCIALSDDEKRVAISGWDGTIKVFSTLSGHQKSEGSRYQIMGCINTLHT